MHVYLYVHLMAHTYLSCVYSGQTADCSATLAVLQEAKEFVKAFGKRSSRVASAISVMDNIYNKLQPQVSKERIRSLSVLHAVTAQLHSLNWVGDVFIPCFCHAMS